MLYIVLYVDDLLLIGSSLAEVKQLKADLSARFEMKDLGEAKFVLGLQITRNRRARTLSLSQSGYIRRLLERYGMSNCNNAAYSHSLRVPSCRSTTAQQKSPHSRSWWTASTPTPP